MPTISIFFGITVQMYWRDHPPPHVHVFYGGAEALIAIESGDVLGGRLPPGALRLVRGWIADQRQALLSNWDRARLLEPLEQVPGADAE
ncbi:MAG: DUF4160 domain-containing protein [Caulobacterales bacterium]|jgi:hypothetical protein